MLRYLQIRDFALIDAVELEFQPGLTVLTGETGAGKSMIVDALELLAGGRAGADWVRGGAERADISATVDLAGAAPELQSLLAEHSIPAHGELQLRRVIGSDGRSRAWLGGQSVPLQILQAAAAMLFDIHGQHEFQSLVRPATHSTWAALLNRSVELESAADERDSRLELLRYQQREIDALQLRDGEIAELHAEHARLANRGRLLLAARAALDALYEAEDGNAHALIARATGGLRGVAGSDAELASLVPLLDEAALRVKDASRALQQYLDALEIDPERLEAIERRLSAAEELGRKHRIAPAALIEHGRALAAELEGLEHAAADLGAIRGELHAALGRYQELARQLSARRTAAARAFATAISGRMQELGMAGGGFLIEVTALESAEPAPHGLDRVEFRVSTNPGQAPRPVAKVASGGELARLSLAVQVCCAAQAVPCMVFDEVDAGIGGAVAEIVGRELRALGRSAQVLCVTHLAQVAAQGHQQLRVAKHSDGRGTRTSVTALAEDARVEEIARMLGGVEITPRTRAHAREMRGRVGGPDATPAS